MEKIQTTLTELVFMLCFFCFLSGTRMRFHHLVLSSDTKMEKKRKTNDFFQTMMSNRQNTGKDFDTARRKARQSSKKKRLLQQHQEKKEKKGPQRNVIHLPVDPQVDIPLPPLSWGELQQHTLSSHGQSVLPPRLGGHGFPKALEVDPQQQALHFQLMDITPSTHYVSSRHSESVYSQGHPSLKRRPVFLVHGTLAPLRPPDQGSDKPQTTGLRFKDCSKIVARVHGFLPYFYLELSHQKTAFYLQHGLDQSAIAIDIQKHLNRVLSVVKTYKYGRRQTNSTEPMVLSVQPVQKRKMMYYDFGQSRLVWKVTVANDQLVSLLRRTLTQNDYGLAAKPTYLKQTVSTQDRQRCRHTQTLVRSIVDSLQGFKTRLSTFVPVSLFECNVSFVQRLMVDCDLRGCQWITIPAGQYSVVCHGDRSRLSTASMEIHVQYKSLYSNDASTDIAWQAVVPMRVLSFDGEMAAESKRFPRPRWSPVILLTQRVWESRQKESDEQAFMLGQSTGTQTSTLTQKFVYPLYRNRLDVRQEWSRWDPTVDFSTGPESRVACQVLTKLVAVVGWSAVVTRMRQIVGRMQSLLAQHAPAYQPRRGYRQKNKVYGWGWEQTRFWRDYEKKRPTSDSAESVVDRLLLLTGYVETLHDTLSVLAQHDSGSSSSSTWSSSVDQALSSIPHGLALTRLSAKCLEDNLNQETTMLDDWATCLRWMQIDFLTGYNIDSFDIRYILKRARVLGCRFVPYWSSLIRQPVNVDCRIYNSKATGQEERVTITVPGLVSLDMLKVIRGSHKLRQYTLDFVCHRFLKSKKEDMKYDLITPYFRGSQAEREKLLVYGLKDALLPLKLMQKLTIVSLQVQMARVTSLVLSMITTRGQGIRTQTLLLRTGRKMGFVIPYLPGEERDEDEIQFQGATVKQPRRGFHSHYIPTLDFASLYPTIIQAFNLCYTTLIETEDDLKRIPLKDREASYINGQDQPPVWFVRRSKQVGLLTTILKDLLTSRSAIKKLMKKANQKAKSASTPEDAEKWLNLVDIYNGQQLAIKVTANSVYGFLSGFILRCVPVGATVTYRGRLAIEHTSNYIERYFSPHRGWPHQADCIYGDTDSVMVDFGPIHIQHCQVMAFLAEALMNRTFTRPMELEFEKVYGPYLLITKKRYAGLMFMPVKEAKDIALSLLAHIDHLMDLLINRHQWTAETIDAGLKKLNTDLYRWQTDQRAFEFDRQRRAKTVSQQSSMDIDSSTFHPFRPIQRSLAFGVPIGMTGSTLLYDKANDPSALVIRPRKARTIFNPSISSIESLRPELLHSAKKTSDIRSFFTRPSTTATQLTTEREWKDVSTTIQKTVQSMRAEAPWTLALIRTAPAETPYSTAPSVEDPHRLLVWLWSLYQWITPSDAFNVKSKKIDTKGLENVRRDTTNFTKKTIDRLTDVLMEHGPSSAEDFVVECGRALLDRVVSKDMLVITKGLQKEMYATPTEQSIMHQKLVARNPATAPKVGDRIPFVFVNALKSDKASDRVEDPFVASSQDLDFLYYFNKKFQRSIVNMFLPIYTDLSSIYTPERIAVLNGQDKVKKKKVEGQINRERTKAIAKLSWDMFSELRHGTATYCSTPQLLSHQGYTDQRSITSSSVVAAASSKRQRCLRCHVILSVGDTGSVERLLCPTCLQQEGPSMLKLATANLSDIEDITLDIQKVCFKCTDKPLMANGELEPCASTTCSTLLLRVETQERKNRLVTLRKTLQLEFSEK